MAGMSLDPIAAEVLLRFSLSGDPIAQANRGGFSGARLWKVRAGTDHLCLRAWPPSLGLETVHEIHRLLEVAKRAGLGFVPIVLCSKAGATVVSHAGRLWEMTTWLPGRADFHNDPKPLRLRNACHALGQLHSAWAGDRPASGSCPAVERRLEQAERFVNLKNSGWRRAGDFDPALGFWTDRAWRLLQHFILDVFRSLSSWRNVTVPLQPCLCDLWHDHVLFEGDTVTGLVDFGSVKRDHVAVDLGRLLGSLVEDDAGRRALGLEAYEEMHPLTPEERELINVLDRTGTVVGAANWLRWLFHERRTYDDMALVARRLGALVTRMEQW